MLKIYPANGAFKALEKVTKTNCLLSQSTQSVMHFLLMYKHTNDFCEMNN